MLFTLRWALKNLWANPARTIKKLTFMILSLTIVVLCIALLDGSNTQIKRSLYYPNGDVTIWTNREGFDLGPVLSDVNQMVGDNGIVFPECLFSGNLIGPEGYVSGNLRGVEPAYIPYFSKSIGWNEAPEAGLQQGEVYLDASLAMQLFVQRGDFINIKIQTEDGLVNADQFRVAGVFMGNPWFFENLVLLHIEDMRRLVLDEKLTNSMLVYFTSTPDEQKLMQYKNELTTHYSQHAQIETRYEREQSFFIQIFIYYRILLMFIISTILITFLIILNFSLQNIYFFEFRSRHRELATLLTFGMKPYTLIGVVIWENIFCLLVSCMVSAGLLTVIAKIVGNYVITDFTQQQLVALLGGNRVPLQFLPASVFILVGAMMFLSLRASIKGARSYMRMHIREIMSVS